MLDRDGKARVVTHRPSRFKDGSTHFILFVLCHTLGRLRNRLSTRNNSLLVSLFVVVVCLLIGSGAPILYGWLSIYPWTALLGFL